jgi:hypothetical protein
MTLPDLVDGLLPPGRHPATVADVRAALVDPFSGSTTRAAIFTFWEDRRRAITDLVEVVGEWLDGSFTTDKPDPADLDLVTIIDGGAFDELPRHRRQVVASLVAGTTTEEFWACDAGVVVAYPPGDLAHARTAVAAGCWAGYFGHTRQGRASGLIELLADGREPVEIAPPDVLAVEEPDAGSSLRAHLGRFDRALQAFDDPDAAERPGLQLMATTLRHKRDELRDKLAASRRVEVEVRPVDGSPLTGPALAALLSALCEGVSAVGSEAPHDPDPIDPVALARALELRAVGGGRDGAVVLRAADPGVRRAVPPPDGHESRIVGALHRILDALDGGAGEGGAAEGGAAEGGAAEGGAADEAATDVRWAVRHHASPVALRLSWPFAEGRSVRVGVGPDGDGDGDGSGGGGA